ncbi:Isoprenylcysteine carboxyl methyltransferase family-domain-containing protein [Cantharellus anzutake]|uniref:Isoprenylcysteine carboxyl methyltransferase family-domain-containing protein n=1 Tax=Cantharellus anzutake TaxID=1750568 RepID=UPI001906ACF7|nr:Isoprenylcysteine carboxyl methyltransferase family-domain-containing protein [Cantharellus anzutake]KAF8339176.1 Isoprenylcysteine carboxyl methyltransferase family-domain-containing protein [Cantharellus anzutake]
MAAPQQSVSEDMGQRKTPSPSASSSTTYYQPENPMETIPTDGFNVHRGEYIPNTPLAASLVSVLLGITFSLGCMLFFNPNGFLESLVSSRELQDRWSLLGFFFAAWAAFHWGEYAVTAGWNRKRCSVDSFLLENGREYHIAHGAAVIEFILTMLLAPGCKRHTIISYFGILLTLFGQWLRSASMIHAASNFSHQVATRKEETHRLVTDGVYAYFRHPSYAGFFYWSLGTQMALQNPIAFTGYAMVTWRFFNHRIRVEERYLLKFFGKEYEEYSGSIWSGIPFISGFVRT